jgi:hypothetical protein
VKDVIMLWLGFLSGLAVGLTIFAAATLDYL